MSRLIAEPMYAVAEHRAFTLKSLYEHAVKSVMALNPEEHRNRQVTLLVHQPGEAYKRQLFDRRMSELLKLTEHYTELSGWRPTRNDLSRAIPRCHVAELVDGLYSYRLSLRIVVRLVDSRLDLLEALRRDYGQITYITPHPGADPNRLAADIRSLNLANPDIGYDLVTYLLTDFTMTPYYREAKEHPTRKLSDLVLDSVKIEAMFAAANARREAGKVTPQLKSLLTGFKTYFDKYDYLTNTQYAWLRYIAGVGQKPS